jgi:DNA (cytosine-5)-methyltransferase 1
MAAKGRQSRSSPLMRYGSVCSGIEAATVAWHDLDWQPAWFSEIEKFPSAVLAHHYPHVPNLGDMTKFEEWNLEPIDLLVGGTPCQSFSVAGLRRGLADPRGNLMLTFLAIAQRHRPRWIVWENVPGVLSSNGGRDFGTFLGALGELGYGWAYRVLDAQWFGVAQRRRRVFVIGYLGDWRHPAKVLFESESVRRDTPPSREARKEVAGSTVQCFDRQSSGEYGTNPVASTVSARDFKSAADLVATFSTPAIGCIKEDHVASAITRNTGSGGETQNPAYVMVQPVVFDWQSGGDARGLDPKETAMLQRNQVPAVAQPITQFGDVAGSLTARHDSSPCSDRGQNVVAQLPMQVRRLTPIECERLQGFPDGYTNIPWRNKPESPDGPRYKALGNSMAVPVMRWIGQRIKRVSDV